MYGFCYALWLSCLSFFLSLAAADKPSFYRDKEANDGTLGSYPHQSFKTTTAVAPRVNFVEYFNKTECDDGAKIFVAPRGNKANAAPIMLDSSGTMIWAPEHHYGEIYNFQVQQYKGEPYLTFWAGNDAVGGHGEGDIHMLDKHYKEYRKLSAGNGMGADLHSFEITVDDTAIFSVYQGIEYPVSMIDPKRDRGWIWDCLFQELDIDSGNVTFQWRATDHISLDESYEKMNKAIEHDRWDWLHLNSVEKDESGNYLVSSRYLRAIIYVSGQTGEILWRLGGKKNSFYDLSDGQAIQFMGQHDAHWTSPEHTHITFFDNRGDWSHRFGDASQGKRLLVDLEQMTVKLDQAFKNPADIWSTSQGSVQTLPNGHVLVGYGFNGALTEYSSNGTVLCDAYFMAASKFSSGDVQSYRNLKFNWTGLPTTDPKIELHDDRLYISWMGSTEVKSWKLEHSFGLAGPIEPLIHLDKTGFETEFQILPYRPIKQFVRVVAVDADGEALASSEPANIGGLSTWMEWQDEPTEASLKSKIEKEQKEKDRKEKEEAAKAAKQQAEKEKAEKEKAEKEKEEQKEHEEQVQKEHEAAQAAAEHEEEQHNMKELKSGLADMRILLALGLLAVLSLILVLWIALGRKISAIGHPEQGRRARSSSVSAWQRLRSTLPGAKTGWSDGADFHLLRESGSEGSGEALSMRHRDDDEPDDKPER